MTLDTTLTFAPLDPLRWPPRDPYDALKESWEREAAAANAVRKSRYPPYHPSYSALDAEDDDGENRYGDIPDRYDDDDGGPEDKGDEDDIPLAQLRKRSVRLRQGSEGLEVRPRGIGVGQLDDISTDSSDEDRDLVEGLRLDNDSDWEELYERRKEVALYDSGSDDD